jgi:bacterial/archaeal transporter family protein
VSWLGFALAGALANALAGTLAKAGLARVETSLATAITSVVVAIATTIFALSRGDGRSLGALDRRTWIFLVLAGVATAGAYLLYFRALGAGDSARVQPIDRLSLVFAIVLAVLFLGEKPSVGLVAGAALMAAGAGVIAVTAPR